jgi:hypothetical protein
MWGRTTLAVLTPLLGQAATANALCTLAVQRKWLQSGNVVSLNGNAGLNALLATTFEKKQA